MAEKDADADLLFDPTRQVEGYKPVCSREILLDDHRPVGFRSCIHTDVSKNRLIRRDAHMNEDLTSILAVVSSIAHQEMVPARKLNMECW